MRKVLGFALAMVIALPLAAFAGQVTGTIKAVDRGNYAFVLEDGTRLWIDEGRLAGLQEGEKVQATYVTQDGKNVVTDLDVRAVVGGIDSSNLGGPTSYFNTKDIQASE